MSSAEHERLLRRARAQDAALFRYRLIGPALEEGLTTKQRGKVVRGIAGRVHAGPGGRGVQVSRKTIDRWIRAWHKGGFEALLPSDRKCEPVTPESVLAMAAALKRENMERTAAQVRRIMVAQAGDAPSERTLQRHFAREDLATPRGSVVFGRFEAEAPNVLWTGDVLHGPLIGGKKTYLAAFLDDHSRFVTGHRWGWSEDSLHLAVAFKRAVAARGLPARAYVFVLDTPAGSPICPATCRNAAPAGSLTFQAQPEIVRQRLHNPGDRKVCRGRWESSPGHVRPAGLARRAARPGCLPGGVHRGLPGIPGRPWLQPADHR